MTMMIATRSNESTKTLLARPGSTEGQIGPAPSPPLRAACRRQRNGSGGERDIFVGNVLSRYRATSGRPLVLGGLFFFCSIPGRDDAAGWR